MDLLFWFVIISGILIGVYLLVILLIDSKDTFSNQARNGVDVVVHIIFNLKE